MEDSEGYQDDPCGYWDCQGMADISNKKVKELKSEVIQRD